jgi:hypothetical protein
MMAAFSNALSEVYFSGGPAGYSWQSTPILLDDCLRDLRLRRENVPVEPSFSIVADKV